jgi:competence protein ComFC
VPSGVRMAVGVPRTWAVYSMGGSVDGLIHSLKYHDYSQSAPFMVGQMWRNANQSKVLPLLQADWVIPVPLHPARFRDRGFNQSERLAELVTKKYGFKMASRKMLCRTRYTLTQTRLSEKGRQTNLKTAFTCPNGNSIEGKTFLLVDDVTTTGSTLAACSSALLAAGAAEVKALVWAWVPKENP